MELNQDLQLSVDFDIGMPLDLINREIFQPDVPLPRPETNPREKQELKEQLEKLKLSMLDEKDRFLLSEANVFQTPMKPKAGANRVLPSKLPASYMLVHREEKWGREFKESVVKKAAAPVADQEKSVVTTKDRAVKREVRDDAINLIEKRFTTSKKVKVGVEKPGCPGVTAVRVIDFIPNLRLLANKTQVIQCDDVIEHELQHKESIGNNDFLLHHFKDAKAEDTKLQLDLHRTALFKFNESQALDKAILRSLQGDKRVDNAEVDRAICFEEVRDFVMNKVDPHEQPSKDLLLQANDYLVMAPKQLNRPIEYIPVTSKISLQKKTKKNTRA